MTKKVQLTVTLEPANVDYVDALADDKFEGNQSMAMRKIIADHSRLINKRSNEE